MPKRKAAADQDNPSPSKKEARLEEDGTIKDHGDDQKEQGDEKAVEDEVAAAAVETAEGDEADETDENAEVDEMAEGAESTKDDDDEDGNGTPAGKRRFFPRVKHLLTREWEGFLGGVLDALEQSGAPMAAAASHKLTNPWYKAFDMVYTGVAVDCSVPHGKNRYHKFKDKIVELWVAIEQHAADDHPLKQRSVDQLTEYRKACSQANKKETATPPVKPPAPPKPVTEKPPSTRRSFASTMALKWRHLNESEALSKLPEPLQSLVHLRHLHAELEIENDSKVEEQFQKALEAFIKEQVSGKDDLFNKSLGLAVLHRLARSPKETKDISEAYELTVKSYLVHIDPTAATEV